MDEPTVVVGRITRAHGVTGEVAVLVISEVPGRFADGATVWLEDGRTLTVESSRPHKDRLLVRFRGVEERALHWLRVGAQPSNTVRVLMSKVGIWDRFTSEKSEKKDAKSAKAS